MELCDYACLVEEKPECAVVSNQAGGYACEHPKIRGLVRTLDCKYSDILMGYFTAGKYHGWCCDGIDEEDAKFIEELMNDVGIEVDRTRLRDSMEAWVYIVKPVAGVLIWENSD